MDESAGLQQLDPLALKLWRTHGLIWTGVITLIAGVLLYLGWHGIIPLPIGVVAIVLAVLVAVFGVWLLPPMRRRYWRYQVSTNEIELQYGVWFREYILIPMMRVQHVELKHGPLMRRFGLASVSIATAAGEHEIPALTLEVAEHLRVRIAELARLATDAE